LLVFREARKGAPTKQGRHARDTYLGLSPGFAKKILQGKPCNLLALS
jgi:hypothetical protein